MNSLHELDFLLSKQLNDLRLIITHYGFEKQFEFILERNLVSNQLNDLSYPGIYLFEIKVDKQMALSDWLKVFKEKWEDQQYKKMFVPNVKLKRIKAHTIQKDWIPLYIGKSRCISKRVKEHLDLKLNKPTFALKLLERENIFGYAFRVSTIKIEVSNYDLIVPVFENELREKFNPIVGRK